MDVHAAVRCPVCFHVNGDQAFPMPSHCAGAGCGGELGLEPIGQPSPLACPECKHALEAFPDAQGALHDCGRCGGQFVEHLRLLDMFRPREARSTVAPVPKPRPISSPGVLRYVPCPICGVLMNRKNFGRTSGVVVDICEVHGTWFDAGELPRVLAFGRAAAAAEMHEEEARRERRAIGASVPRYYHEGPVLCDGTAPGERVLKLLGVAVGVAGLGLDIGTAGGRGW